MHFVSAPRSRLLKRVLFLILLLLGFFLLVKRSWRVSESNFPWSFVGPSKFTNMNPKLIIYNRIPKTGSTSLVRLVHALRGKNQFGVTMLNISQNGFYLNKRNQVLLISNLTERSFSHPLFLHGHFVYLNFDQIGLSTIMQPVYINLIRDPLERMVSRYYFLRFGDDYRPNLIRRRMINPTMRMQSFDDCVLNGGVDCHPTDLWVQVPFFCGTAAYCRIPGDRLALQTAKMRVTEDYLLVGLTEAWDEFVRVLERVLPRIFDRAVDVLTHSTKADLHLRRTKRKFPISDAVRSLFRTNDVYKAEQEFYEFVQSEFRYLSNNIFHESMQSSLQTSKNQSFLIDKQVSFNPQVFFFQKTKP